MKLVDLTYVTGKGSERVEHVKAMEVDNSSGHRVVAQVHFGTRVDDKSSTLFAVPALGLVVDAILDRRGVPQLFLVIIPVRHF